MTIARTVLALLPLLSVILPAQAKVALVAADGQPLTGAYFPPAGQPKGGVLLLHMYGANRTTWEPVQTRLAGRGFHVLALDLRGHGDSAQGPDGARIDIARERTADAATNPFLKMHQDARAGLEHLVSKGAQKGQLAIIGASVGASIALHAAREAPDLVNAVVLMTPGTDYLGVPSLEHAAAFGDRPALILCAEEEADLGSRALKSALTGPKAELRLYPEKGIHGTRMFGRVAAVEADVIEWLEAALATSLSLEVPLTKDVIVDGRIESTEGQAATRIAIPFADGKVAEVRLSRGRAKLLIGFTIPERYLRKNEIVVYLEAGGAGAGAPGEGCWRVSFNPGDPGRKPVMVSKGATGAWTDTDDEGAQAYAMTEDRTRWTAEISLATPRFLGAEVPAPFRMALQINGQRKEDERFYPPTAAVKASPRTWVLARPKDG